MNRIEFLKSWLAWGRLPVLLLALAVAFCTKVYAADMRITDFGAKPDGSKCTAAFARAIGACADAGGGRVVVPPGRWLAGAIHPPLVRLGRCAGLCVESVALHNAPGKVVELTDCENAIFSSVEFTANVTERDFIYIVLGPCPTVQSCSFRIGDGTWDVLDPRHRIVHPFSGKLRRCPPV